MIHLHLLCSMYIMPETNQTLSIKMPVIRVQGIDAGKFLQGQLTCDVLSLSHNKTTLGAYCNIQGKVDSLFWLTYTDDCYWLQMPTELINLTITELKKYAVFSKVTLDTLEQTRQIDELTEIMAGIPAVYASTKGEFFPHDLNLPALGAVSFSKGCYRGQEIVARMQHRGNLKRSLYKFTITNTNVAPGNIISVGPNGDKAGVVVRAYQHLPTEHIGLAVISHNLSKEKLYLHEALITLQTI